ncbi:MAG TPA: DUF6235 family protein [Pseudonocardiaceae bacterium]
MVDDVADDNKCLRLSVGLTRLEQWAANAGQVDKNAVYKALFAVSDGSVFRTHTIVEDLHSSHEFLVLVRDDLVLKIRVRHLDAFEIIYIGSLGQAPGLDLDINMEA